MNQDREQQQSSQSQPGDSNDGQREQKHPNPFKETAANNDGDEANTQEEAKLEQERKEAMTERD